MRECWEFLGVGVKLTTGKPKTRLVDTCTMYEYRILLPIFYKSPSVSFTCSLVRIVKTGMKNRISMI